MTSVIELASLLEESQQEQQMSLLTLLMGQMMVVVGGEGVVRVRLQSPLSWEPVYGQDEFPLAIYSSLSASVALIKSSFLW